MRDSVVIVGSGMMGCGIAARSALAGNPTILVDRQTAQVEQGIARAGECMKVLRENGLEPKGAEVNAEVLLAGTCDLAEALQSAKMVIEAVYENLELKQQLFAEMDSILPPEVPITSNTSGLRITDIARDVKHPERAMTTHFWFPAHLVPLVEVVMSDRTDLAMAEAVRQELNRWGKSAVLVKRDLPGQLANRILQAIIREAVDIVESGLAEPEDVDTAVKMGMGIRFPAWGPLEHVDAVGLDLCRSVQNTVLPDLCDGKKAGALMDRLTEEGNLGYQSGRGIYDWSKKDMEKLRGERDHFIIEALKILKYENSET